MIDTGMVGEPFFIRRLVRKLGLPTRIRSKRFLTHGHLDHAGNLAWLKEWTGATVFAHAEELRRVAGTYPYTGVTRWCGRLETAGRFLFRYRAATIASLTDGEELVLGRIARDSSPRPHGGTLWILQCPTRSALQRRHVCQLLFQRPPARRLEQHAGTLCRRA